MLNQDQDNQTLNIPTVSTPGRIRSHSLKPQHSRIDYARRKSATDISSCLESSTNENNEIDEVITILAPPPPSSSSWFKRRFTLFSFDQPIDNKHHMTTDRLSFSDEKSYKELLNQKRPSLIAQMMEVEM